jgi:hypothetical protein
VDGVLVGAGSLWPLLMHLGKYLGKALGWLLGWWLLGK